MSDPSDRGTGRRRATWVRLMISAVVLVVAVYAGLFWFLRNPALFGTSPEDAKSVSADSARLESDVAFLASIRPSRSIHNPAALQLAADHIEEGFTQAGCTPERHPFQIHEQSYHNIVCSFGPRDAPRVLIGAHYDVFQGSGADGPLMPGADDNASGVAALLELARMIAVEKPELKHRIDLVAFTLEEYVEKRDDGLLLNIGSGRYARQLKEQSAEVRLMISVEMIGYFSSASGSQTYPSPLGPLLKLYYPTTGDFIGVIGQAFDRSLVKRVRLLMQAKESLPVYSINAPAFVPGIDRSDHKAFWAEGYPAAMITDTAEFRNGNYHTPRDTPDTLDYWRMAAVVEGLYRVAVDY